MLLFGLDDPEGTETDGSNSGDSGVVIAEEPLVTQSILAKESIRKEILKS